MGSWMGGGWMSSRVGSVGIWTGNGINSKMTGTAPSHMHPLHMATAILPCTPHTSLVSRPAPLWPTTPLSLRHTSSAVASLPPPLIPAAPLIFTGPMPARCPHRTGGMRTERRIPPEAAIWLTMMVDLQQRPLPPMLPRLCTCHTTSHLLTHFPLPISPLSTHTCSPRTNPRTRKRRPLTGMSTSMGTVSPGRGHVGTATAGLPSTCNHRGPVQRRTSSGGRSGTHKVSTVNMDVAGVLL